MNIEYVVKRFFQAILITFIAVTINFIIPRMIPGDPIEAALSTKIAISGSVSVDVQKVAAVYRKKFGLDKPLHIQYINYLYDLARFELGVSLVNFPEKVSYQILYSLPWTIGLLTVSIILTFIIGTLIGAIMAWPGTHYSFHFIIMPFMLLSTIPFFLLGIILLFVFAILWSVFPAGGGYSPLLIVDYDWETFVDIIYHSCLPALSLIFGGLGAWVLSMRAMMISVQGEDYITYAKAKGLKSSRIFLWYCMRNAMLPQFTNLALTLGTMIGGAVLVEIIFSYPGIGSILFSAIAGKDYFVIQGIVYVLIITLSLSLFIIDLLYPVIDPRIKYSK
tara:strand:+ start:120 stop:1121 length:1002 start_codon:yes stop_codon:yes gene_type:complete